MGVYTYEDNKLVPLIPEIDGEIIVKNADGKMSVPLDPETLGVNEDGKVTVIGGSSGGGGSNPNLLDNPWFTVDQRQGRIADVGTTYYAENTCTTVVGTTDKAYTATYVSATAYSIVIGSTTYYVKVADVISGYVGVGYTVDRYKLIDNKGTLKHVKDGIIFTNEVGYNSFLEQYINTPDLMDIAGKKVTLSVLYYTEVAGADRCFIQFRRNNAAIHTNGGFTPVSGKWDIASCSFTMPTDLVKSDVLTLRIATNYNLKNGADYHIKAVKLELGSVSTLALDTAPNYATELLKCQRYYQVVKGANYYPQAIGICTSTTAVRGIMNVTTEMRTNPVFKWIGTNQRVMFFSTGGDAKTATNTPQFSLAGKNMVTFSLTISNGVAQASGNISFYADFELSADL